VRNAFKHALSFQVSRDRLVSKILEMFINDSNLELEKLVPKALEEVGRFCSIDKLYIWNFHFDNCLMSKSYQWSKPGVKFRFEVGEQIPMNIYSWVLDKIKNKETVSFSNYSEIPEHAVSDKSSFKMSNTLSFLAVPLVSNNKVFGYIGFSSVNKERKWGQRTISLQKTLAKVFVSALEIYNSKQALIRFEDYFSNVTENLKEGLVIADSDGVIERMNLSAKKMLAIDNTDCESKGIKEIIGNDAWEEILSSLKSKEEKTTHIQEAFEFCDAKNNCKWLKFNAASPSKELSFELKNKIVILITDITSQRKIQDQLRHSQSMEALGRVVGGVSHDFNNLLTAVLGYSGLLLDQMPEQSPYRAEIKQIKKAAEQGSSLVNQLLTFSRKKVLSVKIIQINKIVLDSIKMLERLIPKNIVFELNLEGELPRVKLDQVLLQQIIMNLAINARDAMPKGGKIKVSTKLDSDNVLLMIEDNGMGIPEDILPNIFEPFFTTKEEGKGTGLGLSTVYGAVKQSGGEIKVDSRIGKGSAFTISFPKAKRSLNPIVSSSASSLVLEKFRDASETVLLVEDDSSIRQLVKQVLLTKGYKVLEALNGSEALRICKSYPYKIDLLITDLVMPVVSGVELINEFINSRSACKILIISGHIKQSSLSKILSNSNCDYLGKPFSSKRLLTSLESLFESRRSSFEEIIEDPAKKHKISQ